MESKYENVGCCELTASKRSVKIMYRSPYSVLNLEPFYVSIKDLEDVLNGHKSTASLWKPKDKE